jgi:tyrosine decarboxylase/aspartate 1-decarboxylase
MNVVALKVPKPFEVREELMKRNWHVSMTREPNRALRLILMRHMTHANIDLFLEDLDEVCRKLI